MLYRSLIQALLKKREFEFGVKDDDFQFCFTVDTLNLLEFPSGDNLKGWMVMPKHNSEVSLTIVNIIFSHTRLYRSIVMK